MPSLRPAPSIGSRRLQLSPRLSAQTSDVETSMIERPEIAGDWRDGFASWQRDGRPPRYVPDTTMCWSPRLPHRLRARSPGFETTIRCGDCPGCREFEVLRLEKRLVATYAAAAAGAELEPSRVMENRNLTSSKSRARLFAVRVYAPREMHAILSRKLHRWRGVEIEPGVYRAGVDSFVVLSREPGELVARLRRRGFRFHVRPVGKLNRARSFRDVAYGLIVPRSAYGENINRYYRRGLAAAEKVKMEVTKIAEYKRFDRARDPRAVSEALGRLMPPRMRTLRRGLRIRIHNIERRASSPELVQAIMPELRSLIAGIGQWQGESSAPKTLEELERNRRAYQHVARMESDLSVNAKLSDIPPPPFMEEVTEVLANSGSFEERKQRRFEADMRGPPTIEPWMEEERRLRRSAEKTRKEISDRKFRKALAEEKARLLAHLERVRRK